MLNDELNKLRQQYYNAILHLQEKEDIINALPSVEYTNFFEIIDGLVKLLDDDIIKINSLTIHETDEEMKEYLKDELNILLFKKETCENLIKEANEIVKVEEEVYTSPIRHLIFAKTNGDNVYLQEDLKNIAEEYYEDIRDCLISLQFEENLQNLQRQFCNHAKLAKIHELRPFKIRVCYQILSSDIIYVMIAKYKKSDNDKIEREKVIERKKQTQEEMKKIKQKIKDETEKQKLINQNEIVKNEIIEYLNSHRRGDTK